MKEKYWCVMNWRNGNKPTVGHRTKESAQKEAERLAAQCPGEYFTVFEAVGRASTLLPVQPQIGWEEFK